MAITAAELQTALGTNAMNAQVVQWVQPNISTFQEWYVVGNLDAPGKARWCRTTAANDAATQAASVLTQLRA